LLYSPIFVRDNLIFIPIRCT